MAKKPTLPNSPPSLWQRFKQFKIRTALKLEKDRIIYALFGLTALSDARNIISYAFEVTNSGDSLPSDRMHLWLMSPLGIAVAVIESVFLIVFSTLGSYFEETDKNPFKRFLARAWPYVRDSIKAIKNGYKGARSIIYFGLTFGASALVMSNVLLPLGIVLGVTYLASRAWYRTLCYDRKKSQSMNDDLRAWSKMKPEDRLNAAEKNQTLKTALLKLRDAGIIVDLSDNINPQVLIQLIQRQTTKDPVKSYLTCGFNGAVDGLYMYAGLYLLCTLVPALAILVNTVAIFFVCLSILRSLYEENGFQRKLELSACKAEKHLLEKGPQEINTLRRIKELNQKILQLSEFTYLHALGEALRDGLGTYSAVTGLMIVVSLFTPIPLAFVLTVIFIGVGSLIGFSLYNLWKTYQRFPVESKADDLEMARSTTSGWKQGGKQVSFALNQLQEQNQQGHYQNSFLMFVITLVVSCVLSIIYGLKALAKGFGRSKDELNLPPSDSKDEIASPESSPPASPTKPPKGYSHDIILNALKGSVPVFEEDFISSSTPHTTPHFIREATSPYRDLKDTQPLMQSHTTH